MFKIAKQLKYFYQYNTHFYTKCNTFTVWKLLGHEFFIKKKLIIISYRKMSKIIIIAILMTMVLGKTHAQNIYVNEEPQVTSLMNKFMEWNKEKDYVNGWRIQIINTDDRRKMENAIARFRRYFPYINNVSWEQVVPYYKVKVSGFKSGLKAQAFLDEVKEYFPSAITVWEKIKESEFIESVD